MQASSPHKTHPRQRVTSSAPRIKMRTSALRQMNMLVRRNTRASKSRIRSRTRAPVSKRRMKVPIPRRRYHEYLQVEGNSKIKGNPEVENKGDLQDYHKEDLSQEQGLGSSH